MPNVTLCALSTDTVDNDLECPVQACAFNIYSVIACMALMKLSSIENICKVFWAWMSIFRIIQAYNTKDIMQRKFVMKNNNYSVVDLHSWNAMASKFLAAVILNKTKNLSL